MTVNGETTHNQWAFVILAVLFKGEDVDAKGGHGVEKSKDSDGDKELGRGRVVPNEEEPLRLLSFAGWGIKVYLMEPMVGERKGCKYISNSNCMHAVHL